MAAELREDIEVAVVVDIYERHPVSLVPGARESDEIRQVRKRPVAVAMEETVRLQAAHLRIAGPDIYVDMAVVVDVCDARPHRARRIVELRFVRDVRERAVV